jgi:hypothetical protein
MDALFEDDGPVDRTAEAYGRQFSESEGGRLNPVR